MLERLLLNKDDLELASRWRSNDPGPRFYTPDFCVNWENGLHHTLEVKAEGFEGDELYFSKIDRAAPILDANGYPLSVLLYPANTTHPIRRNAGVLKRAQHMVSTYLTDELIGYVTLRCESGPVLVRELCADLAIAPGLVPVLLVAGVLKGDLSRRVLDGSFELTLAHGDLTHLCLLEGVER